MTLKIIRDIGRAMASQLRELTRGLYVLTFISVTCPASELLQVCKLRGNKIKQRDVFYHKDLKSRGDVPREPGQDSIQKACRQCQQTMSFSRDLFPHPGLTGIGLRTRGGGTVEQERDA